MLDYLKSLWARIQVRWHVLVAALLAALPSILDWLGVLDLRPLLEHFLSPQATSLVLAALPFMLTFLKSAVTVEPAEAD